MQQMAALQQMASDQLSARQMGMLMTQLQPNEQIDYGPVQLNYDERGFPNGFLKGQRSRYTGDIWASDIPTFFHEKHHRRQIQNNPLEIIRARFEDMRYGLQAYKTPGTVEYEAEQRMMQDTSAFNQGRMASPYADWPPHLRQLLK